MSLVRTFKNEKDVSYIIDNLRKEDLHEAKAVFDENYKQEILKNIMNSDSYVCIGKDKNSIPVVMGGIAPTAENKTVGIVWLLSTKKVKKHIKCLLKELRTELDKADEKFWLTYNFIYKENISAKKWLSKLGFKFDNPHPEGMNIPEDFQFFYRVREVKGVGE